MCGQEEVGLPSTGDMDGVSERGTCRYRGRLGWETKDGATSTAFDLHSDGRWADLTGVEGTVWHV